MISMNRFFVLIILWMQILTHEVETAACGGAIRSHYGEITSPNYPSNYPENKNCIWNITGPPGSRLMLHFVDFQVAQSTNCNTDFVQMYFDDYSTDRLCGVFNRRKRWLTKANHFEIFFKSGNGRNTERGFRLLWKGVGTTFLTSSNASWSQAKEMCSEEGGTMLTDGSYIEVSQEDLAAKMDAANITEAWIGRYFTPWSWLKGCYTYTDDMLPGRAVHFKSNQQSTCIEYCHDSNYFGLKGNACYCFENIEGQFVTTAHYCKDRCPGNTEERCGGNTGITVYMNDLCFNNSSLWNGTISTSRSGETCRSCNSSSQRCPNESVVNSDSFCRDPTNKGNTWCYTRNGPEDCDIPKCLGRTDINGTYECMAFREITGSRIQARQEKCSKKLLAACQYQSAIVALQPLTWNKGRNRCRFSKSSDGVTYSMADTRHVLLDSGQDFWVGYRRTVMTVSDLSGSFVDCFCVTKHEHGISLTSNKCTGRTRAICQTLPITCGEAYNERKRGKLSFPNTTRTYDSNHNCVWKIMATPPEKMEIYIEFDLEDSVGCISDKIKLYDNDAPEGHPNKTLCGRGNITFYSSGPTVVIQFISDESVNGTGFNASWKVEKDATTTISTTTVFDTATSHTGLKVWLILVVFAATVVFVALMVVLVCYWRRRIRHRDEQSRNVTADTEPHNYEMLTTGSPISSYYNTLDIHEYDDVDQTAVSGRT